MGITAHGVCPFSSGPQAIDYNAWLTNAVISASGAYVNARMWGLSLQIPGP